MVKRAPIGSMVHTGTYWSSYWFIRTTAKFSSELMSSWWLPNSCVVEFTLWKSASMTN